MTATVPELVATSRTPDAAPCTDPAQPELVGGCGEPLVRAPITPIGAERLARALDALSDPTRLRLLSIIRAHAAEGACVLDLTEAVGLSQGTVSHHLGVLAHAGLLEREKRGVWAYFHAIPGALDAVTRELGEL